MKNDFLKATPVLTGKDAKRFLENMRKVDAECEERRKKRKHEKTPPTTPVKFQEISAEEIEAKRSKAWKYMF